MVVLKMGVLTLAHDPQGLGHGAFARREDGTKQQNVHVLEHRLGEQRRTGYHQGDKFAGHAQPPLTFLGGNRQKLTCPAFSFQRSQMDKVELRTFCAAVHLSVQPLVLVQSRLRPIAVSFTQEA
jgi:hypothetical protein